MILEADLATMPDATIRVQGLPTNTEGAENTKSNPKTSASQDSISTKSLIRIRHQLIITRSFTAKSATGVAPAATISHQNTNTPLT